MMAIDGFQQDVGLILFDSKYAFDGKNPITSSSQMSKSIVWNKN